MPQVRVLTKGARVTGGVLSLLYALHTLLWIVRDIAELGAGTLWGVWTWAVPVGSTSAVELPATSPVDLGLLLLQLAATFAAFTGAWTAGGLLACTAALTFADRLPVIWHVLMHTSTDPVYLDRTFETDGAGNAAAGTSLFVAFLCLVLAVVLLAGLRPWPHSRPQNVPWGAAAAPGQAPPFGAPQPYVIQPPQTPVPPYPEPPLPSETPQRPAGGHVALAAVFFGLMVLFNIGWNIHLFTLLGSRFWISSFIGQVNLQAILGVSPVWGYLTMIGAGGAAAVLALTRGLSARGFTLGVGLAVLLPALLGVYSQIATGALVRASGTPTVTYFGFAYSVIMLGGAVAMLVLTMRPGVPAQPGAPVHPGPPMQQGMPMQPGVPFGAGPVPFGAPQQQGQPHPYGPPPAAPQPYGPPPGVPPQPQAPPQVPPQQGAADQQGAPASPPPAGGSGPGYGYPPPQQNPAPPGGAFGPPPSSPPSPPAPAP